jgi:hypothetical protein
MGNSFKDLGDFLRVKFTPEKEDVKYDVMNEREMEEFYVEKIIPVFERLKLYLLDFDFEKVDYVCYSRKAVFKVSEVLSQFRFQVDIDNVHRCVVFYYDVKYRLGRRKKLVSAVVNDRVSVSFGDLGLIDEEMIASVFIKWYMDKDGLIELEKGEG